MIETCEFIWLLSNLKEEGQDVGQTDERNDQNDVYRPRNGVDNMLDNSPQNRGAKGNRPVL